MTRDPVIKKITIEALDSGFIVNANGFKTACKNITNLQDILFNEMTSPASIGLVVGDIMEVSFKADLNPPSDESHKDWREELYQILQMNFPIDVLQTKLRKLIN